MRVCNRRGLRPTLIAALPATMATVSVMKQMHERTGEEKCQGQILNDMRLVLRPQKIRGHGNKPRDDPFTSRRPLTVVVRSALVAHFVTFSECRSRLTCQITCFQVAATSSPPICWRPTSWPLAFSDRGVFRRADHLAWARIGCRSPIRTACSSRAVSHRAGLGRMRRMPVRYQTRTQSLK